jgi:hypothetical protein
MFVFLRALNLKRWLTTKRLPAAPTEQKKRPRLRSREVHTAAKKSDRGQRREATEATEKALNSLDADASPQKNRLKGGRNANEEI